VKTDGSQLTQLAKPAALDILAERAANGDLDATRDLARSPDGARISFAAFSPTASDPGRSAVFVAAGDGTNAKQISDWGDYTTSARWSPTANWIVFDRINGGVSAHSLYLVHPDGSGIKTTPLLSAECLAVWSPDGDHLLVNGPSDQATNLWSVKIDGSHLIQLTHMPTTLTDIGWGAAT
jgi:Tol biopolymer transport system component